MRKTVAISVRLEPDLKGSIERIAREDRRSVASLVEKVLADFVRERGQLEESTPSLPSGRTRRPKAETAR